MIRNKIIKLIENVIGKNNAVNVQGVEDFRYGDYSTNIALRLKLNALKIVEKIKNEIRYKKYNFFEKVEVAGPGFINFFISKNYLQEKIKEILKKGNKFGNLNIGKNKKIQVEFISANPTGPLTIGNARGGPFGDVLANVLSKAGFKTIKTYYINDYGHQIFVLGHSVLKDEKAQYKGDYINQISDKIKIKDPYKAGEKAAKLILKEIILPSVKSLGIKFNQWVSESYLHKKGYVEKVIKILDKKGLLYEKDGAIWFKSKNFGDIRDRVLVKKDGWKTYLAGDIAFHYYKFKKDKFNKVINIWGADHAGDVAGLKAAVEVLGFKGKLDIVLLQFVSIFEKGKKVKMSKRLGTYLTTDDLLKEVPLDVIRFFFIEKSSDTHLNFDLDLAKEQSEKNPVYYIQYAYARICSILKKAKNSKSALEKKNELLSLEHSSELNLAKQLIRFPEIIEDTAKDYQVSRIPKYAFDLATFFHRFYTDCRVVSEDERLTQKRLKLVLATKIVLKNVLEIMGVSAPEKM